MRPANGCKNIIDGIHETDNNSLLVSIQFVPTNGCKDGQCEEAGLDIIPIDGKVLDNHVQILHMITSTRKNII